MRILNGTSLKDPKEIRVYKKLRDLWRKNNKLPKRKENRHKHGPETELRSCKEELHLGSWLHCFQSSRRTPFEYFQQSPMVEDLLVTMVRPYEAGAGTSETKVIATMNDLNFNTSLGFWRNLGLVISTTRLSHHWRWADLYLNILRIWHYLEHKRFMNVFGKISMWSRKGIRLGTRR